VVLTKSIPFSIENQSINLEQLIKLRKLKNEQKAADQNEVDHNPSVDEDDFDLFEELNAILGESDKT
jgi:hypothetical protein